MMAIIKYELKKIFQNKLFIRALILCALAMSVMSAITVVQYKSGTRGSSYPVEYMKSQKMPEVFVSNNNIDHLRRQLHEFESRDEIYYLTKDEELADYKDGGSVYYGRNDVDIEYYFSQYDAGKITESELLKATDFSGVTAIKKEYLPEYFKYYQPVNEYDNKVAAVRRNEIYDEESAKSQYYKQYSEFLKEKEKEELKKGFTVGYDYGWENFYSILANDIGVLLVIVLIFGLQSVFTSEYVLSTDAFLLSSKNGKGTLALCKITASLIYTTICFLSYTLLALLISFIFLGADGANVGDEESNLDKLFTVIPFILLGSYLICFISLAVSSFCKKQITSIVFSCFVCLLPLFAECIYIDNIYVSQLFDVMPVSMVFGAYISNTRYFYWDSSFIDLRYIFPFVAIIVIAICIPITFKKYCNHQVSN